jgi:WXG100 family type VII secretion target
MAQVDVDYGEVNTVATRLRTEGAQIVSELSALQANVAELLTGEGGLWLQQSSPVMAAQYQEFNTSLTAAIKNLDKFADSFNGIAKNLADMDSALAKPPEGGK